MIIKTIIVQENGRCGYKFLLDLLRTKLGYEVENC